jgi:HK97 family phage major capsid protein
MVNVDKLRKKRAEMERELIKVFNEGIESKEGVMDQSQRQKWNNLREGIETLDENIAAAEVMNEREMNEEAKNTKDPENGESREEEKLDMSFGEYLQTVAYSRMPEMKSRADVREKITKIQETRAATGLNEGVPSEGGFLLRPQYEDELLRRTYETGVIASRVDRKPLSGRSNTMKINTIDESSRANGSRFGGVVVYHLAEAAQMTASKPKFGEMELKLNKAAGLCYVTEEMLEDIAFLESVITDAFSEEFSFVIDNDIYRGDGVGKPKGILNSNALVTVSKESGQSANTIEFVNIVKMWSRMYGRSRPNAAWFINQDIEPQLFTMSLAVGTGGIPVYMPAGGASASPYGTLMGRPVIPIEQASTLGTEGDILFADPKQYLMIDKGGMKSASSIHVQFLYDELVFRFIYRYDGQSKWKSTLTPAQGNNELSPFVSLQTRD